MPRTQTHFSPLMALRLCEIKDEAVTVKMNVIYFGVDTISALLTRHKYKNRNKCAKIPLSSLLSNSVFASISYALRLMGFFPSGLSAITVLSIPEINIDSSIFILSGIFTLAKM